MRQTRTTDSPFKVRTFYTLAELEVTGLNELRKAGFLPTTPQPVRIEGFITKRFGVTPDYSAPLPDGILGLTKFGAKGPTEILVSAALGEDTSDVARRRTSSTLAHEAGHCLFHGPLFAVSGRKGDGTLGRGHAVKPDGEGIDKDGSRILCREVGTNAEGYRWWEWQADAMIGPLLMPRPLFASLLSSEFGLTLPDLKGGTVTIERVVAAAVIARMSEVFDVNPAAARVRIAKAGFRPPGA